MTVAPGAWRRRARLAGAGICLGLALAAGPAAAAVPRAVPSVAEIVATKGDEQVTFVEDPKPRAAEVKQDLAAGDGLRTGPAGGLALLFRDATQVRVHRNSTLLVKSVRGPAGDGDTRLGLDRGSAWSRAKSIRGTLNIETPAATAAIRGTDWSLKVEDDGRTTLIVLHGDVEFANAFGSVRVARGEMGVAEVGRAPFKTVLLDPKDRPQWAIDVDPVWLLTLNVTGLAPTALKAAEQRVAGELAQARTPARLLEAAAIAFELDDVAGARAFWREAQGPALPPALGGRSTLLDGLLLLREYAYDAAERALAQAAGALQGRDRLVALRGAFVLRVARARHAEAEQALAALERAAPGDAEVHLSRIQAAAFRRDVERALEEARRARQAFPQDSRFPVWQALLLSLADDMAGMRAAVDAALALDPAQYLGWEVKGVLHHVFDADAERALEAFRRVQAIAPAYAPAWNSVALVHAERGEYAQARAALATAIRLAPRDAVYRASLATLDVVFLDELPAGDEAVREALALDPADPTALRAQGYAALKRGQSEQAIDSLLRASTVNPGLGLAELGIAYYQAGDHAGARQAVDNAVRLSPNDPVPALIGSVMAIDQAEAGRAIELAREALARYERAPTFAVETLAKSQSGIVNVGSAYANLGLADWGLYYGLLSASPSLAMSHLFLSNAYPSATARQAEATQGLLLDPLAVSARARHFDFVRRPFQDWMLGAGLGSEGRAITNRQHLIVQGLERVPEPVAYFGAFQRSESEGFRTNSAHSSERIDLAVGATPGHTTGLLASLVAERARQGLPGAEPDPDDNDRFRNERLAGTFGYHHRVGPANHLLVRAAGGFTRVKILNDDPFGTGLSDRTLSFVQTFGLDATRQLFADGLLDGGLLGPGQLQGSPVFFVTAGCPPCVLPAVTSDFPARLDFKTFRSIETEETSALLQARHLLGLGPVHFTYGAEWAPAWITFTRRSLVPVPTGTGTAVLIPDIADPGQNLVFPFGTAAIRRDRERFERHAVAGYVNADWRITPALVLESGLFLRHYDDDDRIEITQADPRAGLAWRVTPQHWLRVAGQRDVVLPIQGTLAPVATVGLVPRDDFTTAGSTITSYQARWDAEWHRRVFTFVSAEEQRLRRFFLPIPLSLDALTAESARIRAVTSGINLWLGEAWGLFGRYRWTDTENLSKGADHGRRLPLIAEHTADAGVTWVHPWQIRTTASVAYAGKRPADLANTHDLNGHWTLNASASWQPFGKRWAFTLAAQNLLDKRIDVAPGFPAAGLTVSALAEYRFDAK